MAHEVKGDPEEKKPEIKTACLCATASARVCSELAAGPNGPPQTGESGSVLNWH
jgi:hypothetical protein